jgi:hypothetical protein
LFTNYTSQEVRSEEAAAEAKGQKERGAEGEGEQGMKAEHRFQHRYAIIQRKQE